ncbi:MAG TPA: T9SS type A sorting domain-containing protein, partial [Saprospiraceae bacterium]|nr:T9SS type A sorting domain-containing protein [Saprospiraceae bacterium]
FVGQTYDEEIVFLSDWLEKRLAYLDDKWKIETVNTVELSGNKVILSPNPVTDMTQLRMNTLSSVIKPISVLDMNGQIVQIPVIYTGENELSYDFSLCKQGVYFIRYLNDNNILVSKIVKL